jgi:hypothetical protein
LVLRCPKTSLKTQTFEAGLVSDISNAAIAEFDQNKFPPSKEYGDIFLASRWFTKGWTLQELLAPLKLIFYSAE